MTGATLNWYCGLHEPREMAFALHLLRPADLFVDVGSNVGTYTILAGGAVKADVISVEPIPSTFHHLQRNIWLNNLPQVEAHCCGLSSTEGELSFVCTLDTTNRIALPDEVLPTIKVPVTTLDALLNGRLPTLIKIDVEGHELSVLNGACQTLSSPGVGAVILETNSSGLRFGVPDETLFKRMAKFGFQPCDYDPYNRQLRPQQKCSQNTIFVKDIHRVTARCIGAPRYKLVNGDI